MLNTPRSSHAICSFNDRFLYVFCGGQAGKLSLTTVERIEIDMDATWTTIELAKQDEDWLPRSMIGVEQISANELVIYGDQNRNNLTYLLTHKKHGASLQKLVTQIVPAVYGYRYTRVVLGGFLFSFTDTFDYMWSYEHVTKQWNCCGKGGDIKMEGE